jgi:hypothetical protein
MASVEVLDTDVTELDVDAITTNPDLRHCEAARAAFAAAVDA